MLPAHASREDGEQRGSDGSGTVISDVKSFCKLSVKEKELELYKVPEGIPSSDRTYIFIRTNWIRKHKGDGVTRIPRPGFGTSI
jgi:hypothetical protein